MQTLATDARIPGSSVASERAESSAPGALSAEQSALLVSLTALQAEFAPPRTGHLSDDALLATQRMLSEVERRVTAAAAAFAAEVRHRSRPELGAGGLATRLGARTPEKLVQTITGTSKARATTLVRVGSLLPSAPPAPERAPWLTEVLDAVARGELSVEAADATRAGLGAPTEEVPSDALQLAARTLLGLASAVTLEELAVRAREERVALDLALVVEREAQLYGRRSLTLHRQADGMTRMTAMLDPESAAAVTSVFDAVTSPRRGGPRFRPSDEALVQSILDDPRTTEQLALDTFVHLIEAGAAADPSRLIGARGAAVRVLVTDRDLAARVGVGSIEGQTEPVSFATAERHLCTAGSVPVHFDDAGQVANIGREQRLFTARQRIGLAARDGGCRFPGCERPPSWCEAHHIEHWVRDHGRTNIDVGILLCRHHHRLLHNNQWEIRRRGAEYWVVPPPGVDPRQREIPMPSKSAALRRLANQDRSRA